MSKSIKTDNTTINIALSSERGLTLVESLIAMLVTVVGLVSLATMFAVAMKTNASSRNFTTATTFAQDKLEQLETLTFQRLSDPNRMTSNPNAKGPNDTLIVGSLDEDLHAPDGTYYYDKIILAGKNDSQPEGTITIVRPDGTAETRKPDGTVTPGNPFGDHSVNYSRRWVVMSSNESDPVERRLTLGVRVKSENSAPGKQPEQVDLYTVLTNQ
ncbi:MAG: hypothetical protein DMF61_16560 [Blastocatellia bacterium AA13]|nr:MAG: hypothetical protein DMF61_16560 [Blastocatellia bacterium AA13]